MRLALFASCLALTACSGVAWNTRVADTPGARRAMADSVVPGTTTETALIARWGQPVQKIRDGGQTSYVYRNMRNPRGSFPFPDYGDSQNFVIVTFQYGLATGVTTTETAGCRATFTPRPPNYTFDNPTEVRLAAPCDQAKATACEVPK